MNGPRRRLCGPFDAVASALPRPRLLSTPEAVDAAQVLRAATSEYVRLLAADHAAADVLASFGSGANTVIDLGRARRATVTR